MTEKSSFYFCHGIAKKLEFKGFYRWLTTDILPLVLFLLQKIIIQLHQGGKQMEQEKIDINYDCGRITNR